MLGAYVGSARFWEEERIGAGDRVVVAGAYDDIRRRIEPAGGRPVLVFGVPGDGDPRAVLRAELWARRWPIAAQLLLGLLAVVAAWAVPGLRSAPESAVPAVQAQPLDRGQ